MTAPASAPEYGEFVYVWNVVGNPYGNAGSTTGVEYTVDIENLISGGYMAFAPGSVPAPYTPPLGSRGVDPLNPALGQWAYVQNNVGTQYGVAGSTVGVEVTTHIKRLVLDGALSFTLPPTSQYDEFPLYSDNTFASLGMVKDLMYAYYGGYDGSEGDYSHLIISQRLRDAIAEEMSITYDPTVQALLDEARDYNADTKIARDEAGVSETNAKTSETNAKTSETKAKTSETNAKTSEDNAQGHADTATTKAGQAGTSATTATTKAGEAATSAANAKTSETNAKTSETNAAASSGTASTSASTASTKASEASASALAASESETRAKTSETNAETSETNAKTSEDNAKTSETNAKVSEDNAKTSEDNALASENAAATSAANAGTSEANAKTSETNASASAVKAQQHAEEFDLDFTSTTLPPETAATVVVTGDGPAYSVEIGVPQGIQGEQGPPGDVSQAMLNAGLAGKADLEGGVVPLSQLPELGSTDAADLTGALTDQVNVGTSMVTFQYWYDVNGEPVDETSPLKDIITSVVSYGNNFQWIVEQLELKASLDGNGKLLASQLPALAITEFLGTPASQAAMLALSGQRGDWCVRTDRGTQWILIADNPAVIGSWREMVTPAAPVSSVAGRTGAVTLSKSDVGLSAVDNTSDLDKPISNAVSAALGTKAASDHKHPVSDLTMTGTASSATFARGDGTWATPTDTTYSAISQAEAENAASTAARLATGQRLRQAANAAISAREWVGTQAQYDALGSYDPNVTYYVEE